MKEKPSRSEVEESVAEKLRPELSEYTALVNECEGLSFECLTKAAAGSPQAKELLRVHASLLARVMEDLRVCVWAATRGYTLQAWSVAASVFEASHALGFIGADVERARRWLEHQDRDDTPWTVWDSVVATVKFLNMAPDPEKREARAKKQYAIYERLCMAKHVNPIPERHRRWTLGPNSATLVLYPFYSTTVAQEARVGLAMGTYAALTGVWVFYQAHLKGEQDIFDRLLRLMTKTTSLATV